LKLSFSHGLSQNVVEPQPFPKSPQDKGAPQRKAFEETQGGGFFPQGSLGLQGIFGGQEAAEAFDQSPDRFQVQGIGAAEGIQDVGLGVTGLGVPDIVSQLDVSGGRAVFVFARDGSYIRAYLNGIYFLQCQEKNSYAHAYEFRDFSSSASWKINNLPNFQG
jgi:hypothetical protein